MSAEPRKSRPRHEGTDAAPAVVVAIAGALALLVAAGLLAGLGYVHARGAGPQVAGFQHGPEARTSVDVTWAEYVRDTHAHLDGYAWVDRAAGTVRVPLDRAVDLEIAEEARKSP